ncbi:MAG: type II toxin-antitoxin system prevent-host-death family antitoxin [Actinomycetota bacterium]|nr:type II toxin-antitoxin system prevent-host-death family antitoxin [Actinomycetota bacterium]
MVNVHEAKSTLSELLKLVEAGERVIVARAGKPVADLVPHLPRQIVFGTAKGTLTYDDETFDDPDPEIIRMFEGH